MSFQYSKNNHLSFTRGAFPSRGRIARAPGLFRDECLRAADEIATAYKGRSLYVLLSGGIDSEVVAESFRLIGQPFRAAILRYEDDLNIHDISWAALYCDQNDIEFEMFDVDVLELFARSRTLRDAKSLRTSYISHLALADVAAQIARRRNGVPIIGSGEPELQFVGDRSTVVQIESEYAIARYLRREKLAGVPCFFEWSPELYISFILSNEIQQFLYWGAQFYRSSVPVKLDLYERSFGIQRRLKFGGFEKAQSLFPHIREKMKKNYGAKYESFDYEAFMARFF